MKITDSRTETFEVGSRLTIADRGKVFESGRNMHRQPGSTRYYWMVAVYDNRVYRVNLRSGILVLDGGNHGWFAIKAEVGVKSIYSETY